MPSASVPRATHVPFSAQLSPNSETLTDATLPSPLLTQWPAPSLTHDAGLEKPTDTTVHLTRAVSYTHLDVYKRQERFLSWSTFDRGPDAADAAREDGFVVVGLELADHAVPLFQLSVGPDVCIAIGHEEHGLTVGTLAACDAVAFIPQLGRVGSLNVATAAAVAIFELRRRDWSGAPLL